jgi:hypothetical protein
VVTSCKVIAFDQNNALQSVSYIKDLVSCLDNSVWSQSVQASNLNRESEM